MSTTTALEPAVVSTRQGLGFVRRCWNALQEWRKRQKMRAALYSLNSRDLEDIGIAPGEIEYLVSNPDFDQRGIRSVKWVLWLSARC